ncbi:LamB/YcsF family protein [Lachnospiraceae bacterium C1.1]|nr:5-oxoprolinase subunit PxpA [Lachnospiraceae bacterium C1.1]
MKKIDLNCDLGESFGNYKCGMDEKVIPYISSANIACGFHASDPCVMSEAVRMCKEENVEVGAHPGYADLVGFGRRNMNIAPTELKFIVQYQIGALKAFCKANDISLSHVKPHGAMYNMAAKDMKLASAIAEGIYEVDPELILLGLSGSMLVKAARDTGLKAANEVFADRAYEDDGSLVQRTKEGAMITDENLAIERVVQMVKDGTVKTITGNLIELEADSVCLHGDGVKAVEFAKSISERLKAENIKICGLEEVIKGE